MSQQYDAAAKNKHQNCRHDSNVVRIKESHGYTVLPDGWMGGHIRGARICFKSVADRRDGSKGGWQEVYFI